MTPIRNTLSEDAEDLAAVAPSGAAIDRSHKKSSVSNSAVALRNAR